MVPTMVPNNQTILRLPHEVKDAFEELNNELNSADLPFCLKKKRNSYLGKLKSILAMSCFGYNSSTYITTPTLVPSFIKVASIFNVFYPD